MLLQTEFHPKEIMRINDPFVELSASLTGFPVVDLLGTGMADAYWAKVQEKAGSKLADELLSAWQTVKDSSESIETALRTKILSHPELGPLARNVIQMWYLGQWEEAEVVSATAYVEGLVWNAIGAHPQAAKQDGFGVWGLPPRNIEEEIGHE